VIALFLVLLVLACSLVLIAEKSDGR